MIIKNKVVFLQRIERHKTWTNDGKPFVHDDSDGHRFVCLSTQRRRVGGADWVLEGLIDKSEDEKQ